MEKSVAALEVLASESWIADFESDLAQVLSVEEVVIGNIVALRNGMWYVSVRQGSAVSESKEYLCDPKSVGKGLEALKKSLRPSPHGYPVGGGSEVIYQVED